MAQRPFTLVSSTWLDEATCIARGLPRLDVGPGYYAEVRLEDGRTAALRVMTPDRQLLPSSARLRDPQTHDPQTHDPTATAEAVIGDDSMEESLGLPALPDAIELGTDGESLALRLPTGCYLLKFTPPGASPSSFLWGTLRVHHAGSAMTVSGDLYLQRMLPGDLEPALREALSWPDPAPSAGIPCFPRRDYRYYMRATGAALRGMGVELQLEPHLYDHATASWSSQGARTCLLQPVDPPAGYSRQVNYVAGDLKTSTGAVRGRLTAGHVSRYLRKATLEIDRVAASEVPRNSGAGVDYRTIFDRAGWDLHVVESQANLAETSSGTWTDAELHAAMLRHRERTDHDRSWRYHLLCVRRLTSTERGIMYDAYGGDSNNVPREGAAVASHWMIPDHPSWGGVRNQRFGAAPSVYFRTVVHEISHAMGLYHPDGSGNYVMQATNVIAGSATTSSPFPQNILWEHAPIDQKRLRHLPDAWVRPGGKAFGSEHSTAPISVGDGGDAPVGLRLEVTPLLSSVPLGAPVRIRARLVNDSSGELPAPARFSLKAGALSGAVRGPAAADKSFSTIVHCMDEVLPPVRLRPGEALEAEETLLRGRDGALFDAPGLHTITVHADYAVSGVELRVTGRADVLVTPPVDAAHAEAARVVLATKDLLLTLALGGDHLDEGVRALHVALDNPVLRPHFAAIEAKRVARPFFDRPADPQRALAYMREDAVLSGQERKTLHQLTDGAAHASSFDAARRPANAPVEASHAHAAAL